MSELGSIGRYVRNRKCDTTIVVDGSVFNAHKIVLQEHSYFFRKKMAEYGNQSKIVIDNVNAHGMEWCIDFMYTGNCPPNYSMPNLNLNDVSDALQAADVLQVKTMRAKCLEYIERHLTAENCLKAIQIFQKYCEVRVQEAQTYVKNNLLQVIEQKEFLSLSKDDFFKYISESTAVPGVKWKAITLWIEHESQRKMHLYKALDILLSSEMDVLPILFQVIEHRLVCGESSCVDRVCFETENRERSWIHHMTVDSSVKLLRLITSVHFPSEGIAERLQRAITEFLASHIDQAKGVYCHLDFQEFKTFISTVMSESQIQWEYIASWINYEKTRSNHLLDLIKLMDADALTPKFISNHLRDIIKSSNDCLNYILDHLLNAASTQRQITRSLVIYDSKTNLLTLLDTSTNAFAEVKVPSTKSMSRVTSNADELFLHRENILYKLTVDGTWLKLSDIPDYTHTWTQFTAYKNTLLLISNKTMFQYTLSDKTMKYHNGCALGNGFSSTCSDSCIYAVGGTNTHNHAKLYRTTISNGWTGLPAMPILSSNPASVYFKHKLYVMGGAYAGFNSNSVVCFDGTTWVVVSNMLRRRSQFAAMAYDDKILVIGGSSGLITPFEEAEEYNNETYLWTPIGFVKATEGVVSLGVCGVDNASVLFTSPEKGMAPKLFSA